jgi:hypothetical protein
LDAVTRTFTVAPLAKLFTVASLMVISVSKSSAAAAAYIFVLKTPSHRGTAGKSRVDSSSAVLRLPF